MVGSIPRALPVCLVAAVLFMSCLWGVIATGATGPSQPLQPGSATVQSCRPESGVVSGLQQWAVNSQGQFQVTVEWSGSNNLCLTAATSQGVPAAGSRLIASPCRPEAADVQSWGRTADQQIVLTSEPSLCLMASTSGTFGGGIELASCSSACAHGNQQCRWFFGPRNTVILAASAPESQASPPAQCLTASPIRPRTCDPSSPSKHLPFCDASLDMSQRADDLVSRLNNTLLFELITRGTEATGFNEPLNLKSFLWDMACGHGVNVLGTDFGEEAPAVTVPPSPLALAATFDPSLLQEVGDVTAVEARVLHALAYTSSGGTRSWAGVCDMGSLLNILHDPRWGQASSTFGEDPYLTASLAQALAAALQQPNHTNSFAAVATLMGSYVAASGPTPVSSADAKVNVRSLQDTYVPAFEAVVKAGHVAGLSVSDGALNSVPLVADGATLDATKSWVKGGPLLRAQGGAVEGIVSGHHYAGTAEEAVADAVKAGVHQLNAMDSTMMSASLTSALAAKFITQADINAMALKLLATRFALGEFNAVTGTYDTLSPALLNCGSHRELARTAAARSVVLLQNKNKRLPLDATVKSIAVIGPNARNHDTRFGHNLYLHEGGGYQPEVADVLQGITTYAQDLHLHVAYTPGCVVDLNPTNGSACYCCSPAEPQFAEAVELAKLSSVAVVVVGTYDGIESSSTDRPSLLLPGVQGDLIRAVAATSTPVVVVMVNGGPLLLEDSKGDLTSLVDAVVEAWFGGEEAGNGVADVLFGKVSPAGRLPATVYSSATTLQPISSYDVALAPGRTYRYLAAADKPRYYFGYGLSYSKFTYTDLQVVPAVQDACNPVFVSVNVTNSGSVAALEVSQLYVSVPHSTSYPTPQASLQGTNVQQLAPGESVIVSWQLPASQWTTVVANGTRVVTAGAYEVCVGGHQCGDEQGEAQSNTVQGGFHIANVANVSPSNCAAEQQ